MIKTIKKCVLCLFAAVWIVSAAGPAAEADFSEAETLEYRGFLVGLADSLGAQLFRDPEITGVVQVTDTVCWAQEWEQVEQLCARNNVEYVEPNYIADLFEEAGMSESDSNGWSYEAVAAGTAAGNGLNGSGVRIGLIDSGVDPDNLDLQNAVIGTGYDYVLKTSEMCDDVYHGTGIAQVIGGDANALGVTGIAPGAEIIPLRCFSESVSGDALMLSQAIYDAVDVYDCDIISMSWGMRADSETLRNAIRYAYEAGTILVASAGNVDTKYPLGTDIYPAYYEEVISVSSVDNSFVRGDTSQIHETVTLCAPGVAIPIVMEDGTVKAVNGTSFAAPCVTAEAAVLLQLAPSMDPATAMDVMTGRAVDQGDPGHDSSYGYGLLKLDLLIGEGWSCLRRESGEDSDIVRSYGWCARESGRHVVVAAYHESARMTGQYLQTGSNGVICFDREFAPADVHTVQIYCLDSNYEPLAGCDRLSTAAE